MEDIQFGLEYQFCIAFFARKKNNFDAFLAGGKQADIDLSDNEDYLKFVKNLAYSDIWLHNVKEKNSRAVLIL